MGEIRIGLVGLGTHGLRYARHLAAGEVGGAALATVCRRDRVRGETLARDLGTEFTEDYRRILSDPSIDAVVFTVPCDLHATLVPEALQAGKAILVEKPLAPDAAAAAGILRAAGTSGIAMVAQTLRFNSVVRAMRERREGLGTLRFVALSQRFEPSARAWLDEPAAGGVLRNTGVHSFDLIRHLTGLEVDKVTCFARRIVTRKTEDSFGAVLELPGGVLATVDNCRATASRSGRIDLAGEAGQLSGDHAHHRLKEIRGTQWRDLELPPPVPTVRECLSAFVRAVRGEGPVPIPLREGLRAVEIVDACRASAETGLPQAVSRSAC
jgi:predicted dehydrogenase